MSMADELRRQIRRTHKRASVDVDGLGTFNVRELTADEWARYGDSIAEGDKPSDGLSRMIDAIVFGTINEDGSAYFNAEDDDVKAALREMKREAIEQWFGAIMELCGITDAEEEEGPKPSGQPANLRSA